MCDAKTYDCEHFCIPLLHGGYRCVCRKGFKLALDGKHCLYQGDCDAKAHHCDQTCQFENDGYTCQCRSGFVMKKAQNNTCQGNFIHSRAYITCLYIPALISRVYTFPRLYRVFRYSHVFG